MSPAPLHSRLLTGILILGTQKNNMGEVSVSDENPHTIAQVPALFP